MLDSCAIRAALPADAAKLRQLSARIILRHSPWLACSSNLPAQSFASSCEIAEYHRSYSLD
eukprot:6203492-Pleurochrysis_carterae.AAC.2